MPDDEQVVVWQQYPPADPVDQWREMFAAPRRGCWWAGEADGDPSFENPDVPLG